jgi:hypothetical protein
MNPNKNLEEQLRLAGELVEDPSDLDSSCRLSDLVLEMDEWLKGGGFLPDGWGLRRTGYEAIPLRILKAINAHVRRGQEAGHFVTAVMSNSLSDAIARADEECVAALKPIVQYIYNKCPGACWGSPQKVKEWRKSGGAEGLMGDKGESFELIGLIEVEE